MEYPDVVSPAHIKHVHLSMGAMCNVRCTFCYQTDFSPKTKLEETYLAQLEPLWPTVEDVQVQGGEPTVMPNCRVLRDHLAANHPHIKISLVTNGLRLDERWTRFMIDQGDVVNISLNASNPRVYERTVRHGRWDQVLGNFRRLLNLRGSALRPLIRLSYVACAENYDDVPSFVANFIDSGADELSVFFDGRPGALTFLDHVGADALKNLHEGLVKAAQTTGRARTQGVAALADVVADRLRVAA